MTIEDDTNIATIRAMRREITDLRNRCDELFHALACAISVPIDPDTGEAIHNSEQHLLVWARSFMDQKMAADVARVASSKYARDHEWECPINEPGCKRNCGAYGCGN